MTEDLRDLLRSTGLWAIFWTVLLFGFLTFGAPYVLRALGWLFEAMGGVGIQESGL